MATTSASSCDQSRHHDPITCSTGRLRLDCEPDRRSSSEVTIDGGHAAHRRGGDPVRGRGQDLNRGSRRPRPVLATATPVHLGPAGAALYTAAATEFEHATELRLEGSELARSTPVSSPADFFGVESWANLAPGLGLHRTDSATRYRCARASRALTPTTVSATPPKTPIRSLRMGAFRRSGVGGPQQTPRRGKATIGPVRPARDRDALQPLPRGVRRPRLRRGTPPGARLRADAGGALPRRGGSRLADARRRARPLGPGRRPPAGGVGLAHCRCEAPRISYGFRMTVLLAVLTIAGALLAVTGAIDACRGRMREDPKGSGLYSVPSGGPRGFFIALLGAAVALVSGCLGLFT